jgi:hypothetical protein
MFMRDFTGFISVVVVIMILNMSTLEPHIHSTKSVINKLELGALAIAMAC